MCLQCQRIDLCDNLDIRGTSRFFDISDVNAEREPISMFLPRNISRNPDIKPTSTMEAHRPPTPACYKPRRE